MKTGLQLIRDYFGTPDRPVTMEEMKALTKDDRTWFAEEIAKLLGLVPQQSPTSGTVYVAA